MQDSKPATTPMSLGMKLSKPEEYSKEERNEYPFRELIGALLTTDWANCINDRKSYADYVFILGNASIAWEAKKQKAVALSRTRAENMGLTEASKKATYLRSFLTELGLQVPKVIKVFNDNQGAQKLAEF